MAHEWLPRRFDGEANSACCSGMAQTELGTVSLKTKTACQQSAFPLAGWPPWKEGMCTYVHMYI